MTTWEQKGITVPEYEATSWGEEGVRPGERFDGSVTTDPYPGLINSSDADPVRYGFKIGGIGFLVPEFTETEVLDSPPLYPIPLAPGWLVGMLNQRGNVVPVFDLAPVLRSATYVPGPRKVLLLGRSTHMLGLVIDELPKPVLEGERAPENIDRIRELVPFTTPRFRSVGTVWMDFDYRGFLEYLEVGVPKHIGDRNTDYRA